MEKSAGIVIQNIPIGTTRDDLITLFEKELKDQNVIKYVLFPLPENGNCAFVCFKQSPDKAFIERLVARNPAWSITIDSRMQTYCCCTAEVDALIVATIPDIPSCIAMLEKDYGIEGSYDDDSGTFLLKGMMHQLQCAQVRLDNIFKEQLALQKMQLLQIGNSNDSRMKRTWLDDEERREVGSSLTSRTAGRDHLIGRSLKDTPMGKHSVVEDQFEDTQSKEWNRFSDESEFRSLQAASPLRGNQDLYQFRSREYEHEPKSFTSSERSQFLSSFDHDRSNRADVPVSLPHFSDTRHTENLPGIGDYRPNSRHDRFSHSEYTRNSDRLRDSCEPTFASSLSKRVDTFTPGEPLKSDWRRDIVHAADQSGVHREYQSKSRVSPLSDLVPSREKSVLHVDSTFGGWRARSLDIDERVDDRDEVDISRKSGTAFWKEKVDIETDKLHSLPAYFPEFTSRRHLPQSKDPVSSTTLQYGMSKATTREQYLSEQRSDKHGGDFSVDPDEPVATSSEDQKTLFLESYVIKYIMAIERFSVSSIKHQYNVEIRVSTEPGADFSMVVLTGLVGQHPDQVEKASTKFAELYEETFNSIIQRDVSVNADFPKVADAVEHVRKIYRVIAVTDVAGTVTLVGEFRDVMKAVDILNGVQSEIEVGDNERGSEKSYMGLSMRQFGAGKDIDLGESLGGRQDLEKRSYAEEASRLSRRSGKSPDGSSELKPSSYVERSFQKKKHNFDEIGDVDSPRSSAFASLLDTNRYAMTFKDDLQVFVYTGDITRITVDAIVNAANSSLKNYSGVAGAIEEVGGPQFKKDCEDLYRSHGPLKVSEVAHTKATGDLRCHNVIHTVGPLWFSESDEDKCAALLLTTFENVLNYAEQTLEAESLALPAVGTGIFGVPVDLCARAIYGAVNKFLERSSSVRPTLKSIYVVNKDPGTTELIQAVFEGLRQLEFEEQMKSRHSRSPDGEEVLLETPIDVAGRRPCSERQLLKSINRRDEEPGHALMPPHVITGLEKNRGSYSGSDVDDSESHVAKQRVDSRKEGRMPTETVDAMPLKKGFHPDSDSDEF